MGEVKEYSSFSTAGPPETAHRDSIHRGGDESISIWSDTSMSAYNKILHEEGEFTIRENVGKEAREGCNSEFPSVIQHECSVEDTGRGRIIRKIWQGTWSADRDGLCSRCHVKIPVGLLTLWRLHNWDALQIWYGEQHGKD